MFAETDTTPIVVTAWVVGIVGVTYGLWVAIRGRAQVFFYGRVNQGPLVRLLGLLIAAFAAAVAWYILSSPVLEQQ
jgi:hypothetical protein